MDNIAEGFCRGGNKEFVNFLIYSRASAGESQSQLYKALDRKYITLEEFEISFLKSEQVITSLTNFINFLKTKINISYRKTV